LEKKLLNVSVQELSTLAEEFCAFHQVFSKFGNADPVLARFAPLPFSLPLHALGGGMFIIANALYFLTVTGLNDRSNSVRPGLEMNWKFCVRENNLLRVLAARNFQTRFRWTFSRGVC